jgi:preprotein translocase subunit SecG
MISFRELFKQKQLPVFVSIFLCIIGGIFLVSTIILSILYGIERNKIKFNEINDLCLSPYCIKTG